MSIRFQPPITSFLMVILISVLSAVPGQAAEPNCISQDTFGIVANSDEDQTAKIQAYLEELFRRGGGIAYLKAGTYTIKTSLNIPTAVTLSGSWTAPHYTYLSKGTTLYAYGGRGDESGAALLEMQDSSSVKGLTIFYPEQKMPDIQPYPWTIHGQGMHNTVENITLVNSYQGIYMGPQFNELHLIRNVFGCVLRRGVMIDGCSDIGRIENVHFNPHYWGRSGLAVYEGESKPNPVMDIAAQMQRNLEAFIFARTDWEYVFNTFVFAAKIGYHFIANAQGGACNGQFSGIGADMCQYDVVVDKIQPCGILISNGEFVAGQLAPNKLQDRVGILTTDNFDGTLQLSNCSFWGFFRNIMRLEGKGCVTVNQANFMNHTPGEPAVLIDRGRASLNQVFFNCKGPHVKINQDVKRVLLSNNFADGGLEVINLAAEKLSLTNNE